VQGAQRVGHLVEALANLLIVHDYTGSVGTRSSR
jgi:hypothetical protein